TSVCCRDHLPANTVRPRKLSNIELRADTSRRVRAGSPRNRKVKNHALNSTSGSFGRGGCSLWLVNRFVPMQGTIKSILNGVVVIALVLWLLNAFGMFHSLSRIHVGS